MVNSLNELVVNFLEKKDIFEECQFFPNIFALKITGHEKAGFYYIDIKNQEHFALEIEPKTNPIFKINYTNFKRLVNNNQAKFWIEALENGELEKIID